MPVETSLLASLEELFDSRSKGEIPPIPGKLFTQTSVEDRQELEGIIYNLLDKSMLTLAETDIEIGRMLVERDIGTLGEMIDRSFGLVDASEFNYKVLKALKRSGVELSERSKSLKSLFQYYGFTDQISIRNYKSLVYWIIGGPKSMESDPQVVIGRHIAYFSSFMKNMLTENKEESEYDLISICKDAVQTIDVKGDQRYNINVIDHDPIKLTGDPNSAYILLFNVINKVISLSYLESGKGQSNIEIFFNEGGNHGQVDIITEDMLAISKLGFALKALSIKDARKNLPGSSIQIVPENAEPYAGGIVSVYLTKDSNR